MADGAVNASSEKSGASPGTIAQLLRSRAAARPEQAAVIGNDGTGGYETLTYAELLRLSRLLGVLLGERTHDAVRPVVAWSYGNDNALLAVAAYHAVAGVGGVSVPINPASTSAEAADIVARAKATLVIAPSSARALLPAEVDVIEIDDLPHLRAVIEGVTADGPSLDVTTPEECSIVLFTSGTTGRSKGVMHSHVSALAAGAGWAQAFGLTEHDVYQSPFPVYSGAGLHFSGLACLLAGATYVIDEARSTSASLERVDRYRTTVYAAVPSVYRYWLDEGVAGRRLETLRLLDFGGSVMHASTIDELRGALPGVALIQTYGLTEAGPGGLYLPPEDLDRKAGSIGCLGSGGLRFRLDEDRSEAGPDDDDRVGELLFAGPSLMMGYLDDPETTAAVYDGEWMRTGDLVRIDADGYVYFVDRLKDLIIRGGFNISSIEIEEALLEHPSVREVAAFGVPHPALGESVAVALVPHDLIDLVELREFAERRLARVKVPSRVVLLEELPLSPAGKVVKSALRSHPGLTDWRSS